MEQITDNNNETAYSDVRPSIIREAVEATAFHDEVEDAIKESDLRIIEKRIKDHVMSKTTNVKYIDGTTINLRFYEFEIPNEPTDQDFDKIVETVRTEDNAFFVHCDRRFYDTPKTTVYFRSFATWK